MSHTVNVVCWDCKGRGAEPLAPHLVCQTCLGQGHRAIDRTPEGNVPNGYTEWLVSLATGVVPGSR